jgi:hypothetical protein
MNTNLIWKKGFFETTYQIFEDNQKVGELKDNSFTQKAYGNLHNKQYRFETRGFLDQNTVIVENETNLEIGSITYNTWHTRATISISGRKYDWKFNNIWNTRWSLFDSGKIVIDGKGSTTKGNIDLNNVDDFLVLSGLFVTNYYWQYAAIFIALIPIYIVLFT